MRLHLSYRINSLHGAHAFLPNFFAVYLTKCIQKLLRAITTSVNARLMCTLLVERRPEIWNTERPGFREPLQEAMRQQYYYMHNNVLEIQLAADGE